MVKTAQRRDLQGAILGSRILEEAETMSDETKTPQPVHSKTPTELMKLEDQASLDRVANEAAEQARKREQRYDQGHDIFTK